MLQYILERFLTVSIKLIFQNLAGNLNNLPHYLKQVS